MNKELLPANDETFVSASNAKLARGDAIRNLLSDKQLGGLFDLSNGLKWLISEITLDRTPNLWQYLRYKLEIEEVDPEMFARRLSEQFLEHQCDGWFIDFYKFLTGQRALWSSPWSTLRSKPILRLQDRTHVNPPREDGASPSAYLAREAYTDTPSPIVKVELTQDEEIRGLLRELGVREREIVDDVIEHVLPKYESNSRIIHVEEHRTDFEKISRAYNTDSQINRTRLREKLLQTPFILMENTHSERPIYGKPVQLYFGSNELRLYFKGNDSGAFVDPDEYSDSAQELLGDLGVTRTIRVEKRQGDFHGRIIVCSQWGWHVRGLDGFDPNIKVDGLEHAINHPTLKKCEFIWNCIAKPNSDCIRGDLESSTNQDYRNSSTEAVISDDFGRLLIETAWIPDDSSDEMRKPCELTLNDLPPPFERDVALAEQLGMRRDEVAEFAVEHGLPAEMLNDLIQNPHEGEEFFEAWRAARGASPPPGENLDGDPNPPGSVTSTGEGQTRRRGRPKLPVRPVPNLDRWMRRFREELQNITRTVYEPRVRSERVTRASEDTRAWLKGMYTNDDEELICQLCTEIMPFKKRNGEYYFEAVEVFTNEHFGTEHEAQFLALCPLCSAKYKEFVKRNEDIMQEMCDQLTAPYDPDNPIVSFHLGQLRTHLYFVEAHWLAFKEILSSAPCMLNGG